MSYSFKGRVRYSEAENFIVCEQHLDTQHHVNNCQYIRMAADYLQRGFAIYQMRAEYKRQALLGDVFYPAVKVEEKECYCSTFLEGMESLTQSWNLLQSENDLR